MDENTIRTKILEAELEQLQKQNQILDLDIEMRKVEIELQKVTVDSERLLLEIGRRELDNLND